MERRKTTQFLLPLKRNTIDNNCYDIYPTFKLADNNINFDYNSLAAELSAYSQIIIDGYIGIFFESIRSSLETAFKEINKKVHWVNVQAAMKDEEDIDNMILPFMGDKDSIFGTRASIGLKDFYEVDKIKTFKKDTNADINIIYGVGAQLSGWDGLLVYIDLPKNELQFRARAESIANLGANRTFNMPLMYKRFYFVDWVVLNKHKKELSGKIDIVVDGQREEQITWAKWDAIREGLMTMAQNAFRVRPWFEPGVWGGDWIKQKINGLNQDVPNYAWSFELITPENGIIFESSSYLLEVSFDFLMYLEGDLLMGKHKEKFGDVFPIRFDFLDTFNGGNLSIQCHPRPDYMKKHFGENITQEETYYILDQKNDSFVYLGFNENVEPEIFEKSLLESFGNVKELDIAKFVQKHPAKKHDLFLIPPGTIHGSGIDNLVLEISTTPYIFTFKLYDWIRPDLNGLPRPLNIDHGMKNLYFDYKGEKVKQEFISTPKLIQSGTDWKLFELPTHEKHTYKVIRYHFRCEVIIQTENKFNVLSLVEGSSISVETEKGLKQEYQFSETFVVSAAANKYIIKNNSENEAVVVVAFMK